jgi:cardiolipin synthase (CMP-forming)
MRWTVPNILTVMRFAAALGIALVFVLFSRPLADWLAVCLFILAAVTDYVDGHLARAWHQESAFGRMLDPIADKAMVIIALSIIVALSRINPLILLPVSFILLREVFVSGLREFLGAKAGRLRVTWLAKWKTTAQMVAIPTLFIAGVLEYERRQGQVWHSYWFHDWAAWVTANMGLVLIWVAGLLTVLTGLDYLVKAMPFLRERKRDRRG